MLVCLGLVACGGGGGGSPPAAAGPVVTAANYVTVAQETLNAANFLDGSTNLFSGAVTGVQASGSAPLLRFGIAQLPRLNGWLSGAQQQLTGVVQSQSFACPAGGTMMVSVNDANNNSALDAGDSFTLTMSNCAADGEVLNGVMGINVSSVSGDLTTNVFSLGASMTFANLSATSATTSTTGNGNGSMTMVFTSRALNDYSIALTLPSFSATTTYGGSTNTVTLTNCAVSEIVSPVGTGFSSADSVSGGITSSAFGNQSVTIATISPFVTASTDLYPASGQFVVTDAANRKVRMTASNATTVLIEADADANGSYELSISKQWSALI